jgi:hypothetical protein
MRICGPSIFRLWVSMNTEWLRYVLFGMLSLHLDSLGIAEEDAAGSAR